MTKGLPGLKCERKKVGLTQVALAKRVGIARETIASYETNGQDPRMSVARKLAVALNCTVADLVTEPKVAVVSASELAQAEAELRELEARIARLKAASTNSTQEDSDA